MGKINNIINIKTKAILWKFRSAFNKAKKRMSGPDEMALELEKAKERYAGKDRDRVWAFIAGQFSEDFRGNPKYLFAYINRYRPDITAYWLCDNDKTIEQVRLLGFIAHKIGSPAAQYAIDRTGVLVAELVKSVIPDGLKNIKYLNLWHGIGMKRIERRLFVGDISLELARKYIEHGTFYRNNQMLVVTSPTTEREFAEDCGVDPDKFCRSGYLRCLYQQNFEPICTFEHDLRKVKGLPSTTKLIVFAPTYRAKLGETFASAIKDIEALYQCCERNDLLLIFKLHPYMEKETGFLHARDTYKDKPRFWFWDNQDDFYEIMDQMDMAIIDYSSIFSDMVAVGIKHYIRYIFDYEEYMQEGFTIDDYYERTTGEICRTFEELLDAIDTYQERDDSAEFEQINNKLWAYAGGKEDFDKTIQQVMDFNIENRKFKNLYSFDVFDTLISRKVLDPEGIFYAVRDRMIEHGGFPAALLQHYPAIRHSAEMNVREFYRKTLELRQSERVEITFDDIFKRMADVYHLSQEQSALLAEWELQEELDNVVPLKEQIDIVKKLIDDGETVVLISDMYLPKSFVQKMLYKVEPILAKIPLFLSSEYGVLKTSQKLFFEVYKSFEPYYDFQKWIHYGDNMNADETQARKFKICTRKIQKPCFNRIQQNMLKYLSTTDAYLVAAMQAKMCSHTISERDEFVISYVALNMVPYIDWVLRDAEKRGYKKLYFVSRDGYHLKRIADAIINERGLTMATKYIYASRRTWWVPSFIDEVDNGFWSAYGSFVDLKSKDKLLKAMHLDENTFHKFFPAIDLDNINFESKKEVGNIVAILKESKQYHTYLLKMAANERPLVEGYLKQEICFDEDFAVVEYYGRGYTQDAMVKLCQNILGEKIKIPFYYCRSTLPTLEDSIRYNFTTNTLVPLFMEAVFANMPYKSIEKYEMQDNKIVPVIVPLKCESELFCSMENSLPKFASQYAALELKNPEDTDRFLQEFAFDYYRNNLTNVMFAENIGTLWDSVALYGTKREFAPPFTENDIEQFKSKKLGRGDGRLTTNVTMSVARSSSAVREKYDELYQILPGDNLAGGRVLSKAEIETNSKFKKKYEKLLLEAEKYRENYELAVAKNTVQNKVLFVVNGKRLDKYGLGLVRDALRAHCKMEITTICMGETKKTPQEIVNELATARFIIISRPIAQFCKILFRNETKEIMLNNVAFPLYNQDLSTSYFLKWKNKYHRLAGKNDISILQIPSERLESRFRKNYSKNLATDCTLRGCCNTDIYFNENAKIEAREKLSAIFPESAGKKVVLYMPAVRMRRECKQWISMLDMDILQQLIGKEYVVVVNFNTEQIEEKFYNIIEISGFSKMINKGIPLRQLMLAADIILGDYRDTFFESALLQKPVYFTVDDYEEIIKSKNMDLANEFEKYIFGPVVTTEYELAEQIKCIDSYDYSAMKQFRKEMFTDCDGSSVQRVIDYLV